MTAIDELISPLSARSVALSLLLGSHPPRMSARDLTTLGEHFGIAPATTRVALSRMASAGDLVLADGTYALAPRHLERRSVTEELMRPRCRPHSGMWRMAVVVDRGRSAARRAALRTDMMRHRFAELREGVWLRPDNLASHDAPQPEEVRSFVTLPDDERRLARELWDLDNWAETAHLLLDTLRSDGEAMLRLAAAAAAVRHLCTDPALPDELAPEHWPADELRWTYDDYRAELAETLTRITASTPATTTQEKR
ncbi:PaaX family transcriptional regulator C-terminal domain-containing protein [Kribbia dieselivorans]|uniref:PaaX family transcriptional regulator C-terminal domain-containing protein n=1 Tax=Kribbia dieselivorans TaxID=331526 RepID=UPI000838F7A6|nr:PaaX family transcriptional regulator C-terminal domain-containing protein [Kribbia dieselivorans]